MCPSNLIFWKLYSQMKHGHLIPKALGRSRSNPFYHTKMNKKKKTSHTLQGRRIRRKTLQSPQGIRSLSTTIKKKRKEGGGKEKAPHYRVGCFHFLSFSKISVGFFVSHVFGPHNSPFPLY